MSSASIRWAHAPLAWLAARGPALLAAALVLVPRGALADVKIDMQADPKQVGIDGQVVVQISVTSDSLRGAEVELPEFEGFSVLRQGVQRPMQFSFGLGGQQRVQSSTNYTFVLQPERVGRIVIPPAAVNDGSRRLETESLAIMVTGGAGSPQNPPSDPGSQTPSQGPATDPQVQQGEPGEAAPEITTDGEVIDAKKVDPQAFLRTVVDKQHPYEREQVTVTIYLYTRERLHEAPAVDSEPTTDGFWTQDLQQSNTLEQLPAEQVGRARFRVYVMRRFAAFPLRSGELTIGAMGVTIRRPATVFQIFGRGGGGRAPLKRTGIPITLEVKPLPEEGRPPGDVAVGRYALKAELDRDQVATGDATTLRATIRGYGHIQSVRLPSPTQDGLQVLAPETQDLIESPNDHVGGTRVFEWLLVPQKPGTYTVPSFVIPTFDPQRERYVQVKSEPLTLTAAGLAVAGGDPPATQDAAPDEQPGEAPAEGAELSWGPIRHDSALARRAGTNGALEILPFGLLVPPLAWLLLLGADGVRRLRARGGDAQDTAEREARDHLRQAGQAAQQGDGAGYHAALASALTRLLEARLGEPVGSDTRPQLKKRVTAHGMDPTLAEALVGLLATCDEARFSPMGSSASALQETHRQADQVFTRLTQFTPKRREAA